MSKRETKNPASGWAMAPRPDLLPVWKPSLAAQSKPTPITGRAAQLRADSGSVGRQVAELIGAKGRAKPSTPTCQLRAYSLVEPSAAKHYKDGWGAVYGITDDSTLKTKVGNVKGQGKISLGWYVVKTWNYNGDTYRNLKEAFIMYKDAYEGIGKYRSVYTSIYHCGPGGPTQQQKLDPITNTWV